MQTKALLIRFFKTILFVGVLLLILIYSIGCKRSEGKKIMNETSQLDWKSLEFKCVQEKKLWPVIRNEEAEKWFQLGRRMEKENREGTEQAIVNAYEKASAENHFKAISNLIRIYALGIGVPVNQTKAVEYAERLIEMNIGVGYYHMGVFLEQGIGVKQDRLAALSYFRKAADLGNAQGQYVVGDKLITEFAASAEKDKVIPIAIQMLECALAQGDQKSGILLGSYFLVGEENNERGLYYYQKTAALGNSQSLYTLYSIFQNGEHGVEKDPARAACYKRLDDELDAEKTKTFPHIDNICPLPPKPMPHG
jgi:TPR repeat protein